MSPRFLTLLSCGLLVGFVGLASLPMVAAEASGNEDGSPSYCVIHNQQTAACVFLLEGSCAARVTASPANLDECAPVLEPSTEYCFGTLCIFVTHPGCPIGYDLAGDGHCVDIADILTAAG